MRILILLALSALPALSQCGPAAVRKPIGNGQYSCVPKATVVQRTGTLTSGKVPAVDASGNLVDSPMSCTGGNCSIDTTVPTGAPAGTVAAVDVVNDSADKLPALTSSTFSNRLMLSMFDGGGTEWTGAGVTDDTTDLGITAKTIKVTAGVSSGPAATKTLAVDLSAYSGYVVRFYAVNAANISGVDFSVSNAGWTKNYYCNVTSGWQEGWNTLSFQFVNCDGTNSPSWAAVDQIRVKVVTNSGGGATVNFAELYAFKNPNTKAKVMFTFDDSLADTYSIARPILAKKGWRATSFVIQGTVGQAGLMTLAQLQNLQNTYGWEIGSHTTSATLLTSLTNDQIVDDYRHFLQWARGNGILRPIALAYPNGARNAAIQTTTAQYFVFGRATCTTGTTGGIYDVTAPDRRMALCVPANLQLGSAITLANAEAAIDLCVSRSLVCAVMVHGLVAAAPASTQWTTANFQALVDYIATKDVEVVTFRDLARTYYPDLNLR